MKGQAASILDYDIGKTLGEGTFGKVKLGWHRGVKEHVAIKILYKNRITEQSDVERITRQIAILKAVSHHNVVKLFQIIETKEEIYLVMEYAKQGDLIGYIRAREKLKEEEAAKFFNEIINAVEYIHSIGVAHRDLKPSNILLGGDNQIKLADFGLSNMYKEGFKLNSPCGSPCYAAPEVIQGKAYQPITADIWSMGVILFIMIAGYLPFQHKNTHSLYKLILNAKYEVPGCMSRLAADLIDSIFKTNPVKRARLKDIKNHPWLRLHMSPLQETLPRQMNHLILNDKVLQVMNKAGHKIEQVLEQVKKNRFGQLSTLYHLYCLKNQKQLEILVDSMEKKEWVVRGKMQRSISIEQRNPVEASHSTRKLLKRTPKQQNAVLIRKSNSKQKKIATTSYLFKGAYQKMVKNCSSNSISAQNSRSFCSELSKTQDTSRPKEELKKNSTFGKLSTSITVNTLNDSYSIERRISVEKGIRNKRFSFIKKVPQQSMDIYSGPFILENLFTQQPTELKQKIANYARTYKMNYKELDEWLLQLKINDKEEVLTILFNKLYNCPGVVIIRFCGDDSAILSRKLLGYLNSSG